MKKKTNYLIFLCTISLYYIFNMDRIVLAELLFITPLVLHRLHMQVDFVYTKRFKNLINKLTSNVMQAC